MVSMPLKNSLLVFALAVLTIAVTYAGAQNPPAQPPPAPSPPPAADAPAQPPAAAAGPGQGRGQRGVFPAMQRPLADPAVIERGRTLYGLNCSACHGVDARGGQLSGPNLLRSQLVLLDQNGELIAPGGSAAGAPSAACRRSSFPKGTSRPSSNSSTA